MSNPTDLPGRSVPVAMPTKTPAPTVDPSDALYVPRPSDAWAPPLSIALRLARQDLPVQQAANIHDHTAMVTAATVLEIRLRQVLDAYDADRAAPVRPLAERQGGAA